MTIINLQEVISAKVEHFFEAHTDPRSVIIFHLSIDSTKDDKKFTDIFDLLFYQPRSYMLVGHKKFKHGIVDEYDGEYQTVAYHDTGWNIDGFTFLDYLYRTQVYDISLNEIKRTLGKVDLSKNEKAFVFKEMD